MAAHRCGLAHSKVNAAVRGWQRRLSAFAVAAALAFTAVPAQAVAAPDASEVERLYTQGQERKEAKDFKGAAESWTRLLNLLPESGENQGIRESVLINVLDAHIAAYNQLVDAEGGKDIRHLQRGEDTLNQYYADFQRVHGDRVAISSSVQDSATALEKLLEEARKVDDPPPPIPGEGEGDKPDEGVVNNPPPPQPAAAPVDNGLGMLIGGVSLGVLGIGAVVMIPVGSSLGKRAESDYSEASAAITAADPGSLEQEIAEADLEDAEALGNRANAVLIAGAVMAPLFLGTSAALIVVGLRRRKQARGSAALRPRETLTAVPSVSPRFSGVSLTGRF